LPDVLRVDNGPEFLGGEFVSWAESAGIFIQYIQPGEPNQNAYIERSNRTYRKEVLNLYLFRNLAEVRETTYWWMINYNENRPHDSLENMTPLEVMEQYAGKTLLSNCLLDRKAYDDRVESSGSSESLDTPYGRVTLSRRHGQITVFENDAIVVALMILIDDWTGLSARFKLAVQVLAVLFLLYNGVVLELFPLKTFWGYGLNVLLTVLWIVGITNALNFLDGTWMDWPEA
jgi:hypothetical protein